MFDNDGASVSPDQPTNLWRTKLRNQFAIMVTRSSRTDGYTFSGEVLSGILHLVVALVLVASHVQAEMNATGTNQDGMEFFERFQSGSLSRLDLVLMVSLGVLAMEAVNFISYSLGGMFYQRDRFLSKKLVFRSHFLLNRFLHQHC